MTEPPKEMSGFRPNAEVLMRKVDDEFVLVHMGRNRIFALNSTGARLWELLSEGRSRGDAVEQLSREFDVDLRTVDAEAESLLRQLVREGLLEVDAP